MNQPTSTPVKPLVPLTQYQRDLETLSRIEDVEYQCFFCAMAELHAQQRQEATKT